MAGIKLLTKLDVTTCLKLARRAAQDLGFTLTAPEENAKGFTATRGNAILGMLAGALAPHCVFQISVESYSDANEIVLEKNTPWLTSGSVGVGKVARQAEELINAIVLAIEREGGAILERKEI